MDNGPLIRETTAAVERNPRQQLGPRPDLAHV
jgi:hypothetical protein